MLYKMALLFIQRQLYTIIRALCILVYRVCLNDYEQIVIFGQKILELSNVASLQVGHIQYMKKKSLQLNCFDLNYDSPLTFAAFESHLDSIYLWLNLGIGGGCLKTIKLKSSCGNKRPRMQYLAIDNDAHLINALGLPGPGVDQLISIINNSKLGTYSCPLGISIGGDGLAEYKQVLNHLIDQNITLALAQPYFEFNISCPNTKTGKNMHENLSELEKLLKYARTITDRVLVLKVSPDTPNQLLCDIASLAKAYDKVTLNAGNTTYRKCESIGLEKNKISIGGGGLSGPSLYARTIEIAKCLEPFGLPIIATGGVSTCEQIIDLKNSGVAVVGMATSLVRNPFIIPKINKQLVKEYYCNEK